MASADGAPPEKVEKLRTKYGRSPVVLLAWVRGDGDAVRRREDRDATAAAVQNLLLGATAFGLASYWGARCPTRLGPGAARFARVWTTTTTSWRQPGWPRAAGSLPHPGPPPRSTVGVAMHDGGPLGEPGHDAHHRHRAPARRHRVPRDGSSPSLASPR
ncbi:MAG: hypothetical protein R2711_19325 [Acidimicrobiales bacterium]